MTKYLENEKIIKIREIGDSLYIIKEGTVSIRNEIKEVRKLHQYDYFWRNAILINTKRMMDVVVIEKTICYELSKNDLIEALVDKYIKCVFLT